VKTSKLILASFFVMAAVQMASAQIEIRITGSTAFRTAVHTAIQNILQPGFTIGYTGNGANVLGATEAIFKGTTVTSGIAVTIKTAWSGSVGGVFSLTTGNGIPDPTANPAITAGFLVDSTPTSAPPGTANVPATFEVPVAPAAADKAGFPNITMSDSFQASAGPISKTLTTPVLVGWSGDPTSGKIGVVPFVWVRNAGAPTTLSNMTNQLASAVLTQGSLPLYQFTNVATDVIQVFVTGRNNDSGTRLDAFAESGFGIGGSAEQVDPTNPAPGGFDHIAAGAWVAGANGVTFYNPTTTGRSSGGTLAGDMTATGSNTNLNSTTSVGTVPGGWLVTYLGINDSNTVNGGANDMTYNGVAYSPLAVEQGQYTFWAYEHLYFSPQLHALPATDNHIVVANQLATRLTNVDATASGILLSSMLVARVAEGLPVF
jgi:hypothetical protein